MCTHAHTRARTHAHALPGLRAQQPFSVSLLGRVPLRFRASARSRAPLPLQSQSAAPVAQLRAPREAGARARSALGPHPAASWHTRSDELIIGSFADDVEGGGQTSGTYPRIRRSERRWPGQRLRAAYTLPFGAGAPQGGLSDELRSAQWTLTQSCLCLCTSSPGAAAAGPPPSTHSMGRPHGNGGHAPCAHCRPPCSRASTQGLLSCLARAPRHISQTLGARPKVTQSGSHQARPTVFHQTLAQHTHVCTHTDIHTRIYTQTQTHTDYTYIHMQTYTHRRVHTHAQHTRRGPERHA